MKVSVRHVSRADASALCDVINPIIEKGGTTAHEDPHDAAYFETKIGALGPRDFFHVAEAGGRVVGMQYVQSHPDIDPDTGDIASFVALDAAGMGVGKALAEATFAEAKRRGWTSLFAYIRGDNEGGLAYYESIGFRTVKVDEKRPLKDGTLVDRIAKLKSL